MGDVGGGSRQAVVVHRGPVGVPECVEVTIVENSLAVTGEPAAQVFAIDGLKVGDARGAHAEAKAVSGAEVNNAIHLCEGVMVYELAPAHDAGVIHHLLRQGKRGQAPVGNEVAGVVGQGPFFNHAIHARGIRRRSDLGDLQDGI